MSAEGYSTNPHETLPEAVKAEHRPDQPVFCEACGERSKKLLFLDHNHANGRVRKWVCYGCNSAIGFAKEDPETLRKIAEYIEAHNGIAGAHVNETTERFRERAIGILGQRECEECGESFHAERSTARFCSADCRLRSHRHEKRQLSVSTRNANGGEVSQAIEVAFPRSEVPSRAPEPPYVEIRQAPSAWVRGEWSAICGSHAAVSDWRAARVLARKLIAAGLPPERPVRVITNGWPVVDHPSLGEMADEAEGAPVWPQLPRRDWEGAAVAAERVRDEFARIVAAAGRREVIREVVA